jgi:hypothetical protein
VTSRSPTVAVAAILLLLPPTPASAADPDVPLAPRPPTLPELTHPDDEISGETTLGVLTPSILKAFDYNSSEVAAIVQRIGAEIPLSLSPHLYVGGAYEMAAGSPPGGGAFKLVPSNLDLYGRVVWASHSGMTFGGGAGVFAPTAQFGANDDASRVAAAAQAIRPWDYAFFLDDSVTLHAFVDVRAVADRFILQFREGLSDSLSLAGASPEVAAVLQVYAGYRVVPLLGVGLEAFETYLIESPDITTVAQDHTRATFTISPSARLMTPYVQPVIGFVTAIGDPLFGFGSVDGFWAIRIGASIVWDPHAKKVRETP